MVLPHHGNTVANAPRFFGPDLDQQRPSHILLPHCFIDIEVGRLLRVGIMIRRKGAANDETT
jgi:hypothetical protein